jgi:DNA-directed RNA polymerase specialized sigma subunit
MLQLRYWKRSAAETHLVVTKDEHNFEDEFISHIEVSGSARLFNCIRRSLDTGRFPFNDLADYFSRSESTRVARLLSVENLGKKTAREFERLAHEFVRDNRARNQTSALAVTPEKDSLIATLSSGVRPRVKGSVDKNADRPNRDSDSSSERLFWPLSAREIYVLGQRFGVTDGQKKTLNEIGDDLGITRERIRQKEGS